MSNNLIASASPFEDVASLNFMPAQNNALIDGGTVIGGFQKTYFGSAPDIGAYERGGTYWTAGVNAVMDIGD